MNKIIGFFSGIGCIGAIIMLLLIAGGVDCDEISIIDSAKGIVVCMIIMALSVAGIMKLERDEEESVYDRL